MNQCFVFSSETREVPGFIYLFLSTKKSEGKLDAVAPEPAIFHIPLFLLNLGPIRQGAFTKK